MDKSFFKPEKSASLIEQDILSVFRTENVEQIQPGMSPKEIAEVTSNHLISVIKEQFEVAKNNFHKNL
jgi:hypothetical protein